MAEKIKTEYVDVRVSFDIETTSYRDNDEKRAIVYSYAFCVDGKVTVMRTASEFMAFADGLAAEHGASPARRVVVWVHNLAYEFQFIRAHFAWEEVFANGDSTNVIRAVTDTGLEFRCTYALTNAPLAHVGKTVGVAKGGDFDYGLMRHSGTPLSPEEIGYVHNDVLILDALIKQRLEQDTLASIPMTKTGYVRRTLKQRTLKNDFEGGSYSDWIRSLRLSPDTYDMARLAYQGGYTHGNARHAGHVVENVRGCDIASSYPASLAQFMFPISNFVDVPEALLSDAEEVSENLEHMACMVDITFHDFVSSTAFPPLSESRCSELRDAVIDNGRVYAAERARVTITDVDFRTYMRAYDSPAFTVHAMKVAEYGYLPSPLVGGILELYSAKTELKGVAGSEREYAQAKEDVNSIYGMMGTDPVRTNFTSDVHGNLELQVTSLDENLRDHNTSRKRFLFYPWGAWVTAYSRFVLLDLIYSMEEAGIEVIYCDTDSDYFVDHPAADRIIAEANAKVQARMQAAMIHHTSLHEDPFFDARAEDPTRAWTPLDRKGLPHQLGYFEMDAEPIDEFKTLGAKRYAKQIGDDFSVTVSGLTKRAASYILEQGGMEFFADGMTIPAEHSGRLTHTYSREVAHNLMTDYQGNVTEVWQDSFIHLEPSDYHLSVSDVYEDFMQRMQSPEAFRR